MDSIEVFYKIFNKNQILGRALINQIKNWPTRPSNLEKNCRIFKQLNKDDAAIVKDLSNECYEILCVSAYTRKALIQRELMNMQYYILLDEAMRTSLEQDDVVSKGGRIQKGGIGLKQLIAKLGIAFELLGSSEGTQPIVVPISSQEIGNDSSTIFSPPVPYSSSEEELQKNRMVVAEREINELIENKKPWVLPETSIMIAKGITQGQASSFETTIEELNSRLATASKDATVMCGEIASAASRLDVFSNDAFVQQVLTIAGDLTTESQKKRTSDIAQDKAAYATKGTLTLVKNTLYGAVTGTSSSEKNVDSSVVMQQAYDQVLSQINQGKTGQTESYLYSQKYQELCRATPRPKFEVFVDETEAGTKDLSVKTSFGNNNTGSLLLAHIETIERIKVKLRDTTLTKPNKDVLESLLERVQMEISLIESSGLFAPLDGAVLTPGRSMFTGFIGDSTAATINFEAIVSQIAESLPLSGQAADTLLQVKRSTFKIKQAARNQAADEWKTYLSDSTKTATSILGDAVINTVDGTMAAASGAANIVVDKTTGLAKNVLTSSGDILDTAVDEAGNILNTAVDEVGVLANKGMDIAGDVVEKASETVANSIYNLLPMAVALLGVGGAAAWIVIWFKKNMFSFGNGNAQQQLQQLQQQLREQQQLQQQLQQIIMQQQTAQPALPAALPAAPNQGVYLPPHIPIPPGAPPAGRYGGKIRKTRKNKKNKTRKMKGGKRRQTKHRKNRQTKKR